MLARCCAPAAAAADVINDFVVHVALHCVYSKFGIVSLLQTPMPAALPSSGSIQCSARVVFHAQGATSCLLRQ